MEEFRRLLIPVQITNKSKCEQSGEGEKRKEREGKGREGEGDIRDCPGVTLEIEQSHSISVFRHDE